MATAEPGSRPPHRPPDEPPEPQDTPAPATAHGRLPGLALSVLVGAAGWGLGALAPALGAVTMAIVCGVVWGNLRPPGARLQPGVRFSEKTVLAWAVALLGARLDLGVLTALGPGALAAVVGCVALTLLLGRALARPLELPVPLAVLLGVGTAICGSSAVAAAAPLVARDRPADAGLAVGVVNLLGTLGILLLPLVATALALDPNGAALLIGGSLQAVGHVVAAGFTLGDPVGEAATAVKMGRVALLVPLVVILGVVYGRGPRAGDAARAPGALRLRLPGYLYGFVALAALHNLGWLPAAVEPAAGHASKALLAIAMAAIGLRIQLRTMLRQAPKALLGGALLFAVQLGALAAWLVCT
jgi:uncharacterized integral membrane protein (TIGR00698 family)